MSAKAISCQLYKRHVSPVGRQMDDELKAGAAGIMSRVAQWQTRGAMRACGPMEFAGDIIFLAMVAETQNDAMFWQRLKRLQLCPIPTFDNHQTPPYFFNLSTVHRPPTKKGSQCARLTGNLWRFALRGVSESVGGGAVAFRFSRSVMVWRRGGNACETRTRSRDEEN